MTALDTALAGSDVTSAALPSTIQAYLWVESRPTKATARIAQASFTYPVVSFEVDGTSNWSTVSPGDTVLVGTTAGASDIGIYRVRFADSDTLTIGETSEGDPGLVPAGVRTSAFIDNAFVTVVAGRNLWSILPFIDGINIYEDHDTTIGTANTNPAPLAYCTANGENNHYATFCDVGQVYATITFVADKALWPPSSSVTYAWTAPAAWGSPTAGATNTNTVTYHVPRSVAEYELKLTVTEDSVSISQLRVMKIWVGERTGTYAPIPIAAPLTLTYSETGASFSFTLNDAALALIPDGALVHISLDAKFGGVAIASAVTHFTGWLLRANKTAANGLRQANVEFIGPAGVLDLRRGTSQIWGLNFGAGTWQYAPATVLSLSFAIWWLLHTRAAGVLELFGLNLYSTDPTGQALPEIEVSAASLWQQVTSLADGIGKRRIGCDPDGTIWVQPEQALVPYADRGAIVKRDTWTESIASEDSLTREYFPQVGYVEGEAFYWDGSSAQPTPILAYGAGTAPGQGVADDKVQGQVLVDQTALSDLSQQFYASRNPDYSPGTVKIAGARGLLIKPAQRALVRYTKSAAFDAANAAFDRYLIPTSVTITIGDDGASDSEIAVSVETAGIGGTTKAVPVVNADIYTSAPPYTAQPSFDLQLPEVRYPDGPGLPLASVPPAALTPTGGKIAHFTGEELLVASPTELFFLKNIIKLHTPQYITLTPSSMGSFENQAVAVDPFLTATLVPGWSLTSDGTDSVVMYNPNVAAPGAASAWTNGATVSGVYKVLRATKVKGGIFIYTPSLNGSGPATQTSDFAIDAQGWVVNPAHADGPHGVYVAGSYWESQDHTDGGGNHQAEMSIKYTFPASVYVTSIEIFYQTGANGGGGTRSIYGGAFSDVLNTGTGTFHDTFTVNASMSVLTVFLDTAGGGSAPPTNTITKIIVNTNDPTGAAVAYSSDDGATFGAAIAIGDTPGAVGGFDVQPAGTVSYAAAAGKVRKATTLGGAYSDWYAVPGGANPVCIINPWYKKNSVTLLNTSTATPDCLIGCDDGEWYWIDGATATATNILSGFIPDSPNAATTFYGKNIGLIGKASGVYKYKYSLDGGSSFATGSNLSGPTHIRTRRRDNIRRAGSPASGQIYLADPGVDTILYSSKWGSNSIANNDRVLPTTGIFCFDTVY